MPEQACRWLKHPQDEAESGLQLLYAAIRLAGCIRILPSRKWLRESTVQFDGSAKAPRWLPPPIGSGFDKRFGQVPVHQGNYRRAVSGVPQQIDRLRNPGSISNQCDRPRTWLRSLPVLLLRLGDILFRILRAP